MSGSRSYVVPNSIIAGRVVLAFVSIWLLGRAEVAAVTAGVALIVVVIAMDGLDGYLARKLDLESELGGLLDITADRIVEHIYWIAFAVAGAVGLWAPLVVMTRSFVVDAARGMALTHGKTAFGGSTLQRSALTRFLTGSRFMRTLYAVAKTAAFVLLGAVLALGRMEAEGGGPGVGPSEAVATAARLTVWLAVGLCVVRGLPVVWDSRAYLAGDRDAGGEGAAA